MKIIVIAYRHWSVGREYRSLILNAKRLGHQVWGFAETHHRDAPFTLTAFKELGVEAYPGEELEKQIGMINPDLICGTRCLPHFKIEQLGQKWVNTHKKVGFLLNHYVILPSSFEIGLYLGPQSHLLCTNEMQRQACTGIWPLEQVHVLGAPGFDFINEDLNVEVIRNKLGAKPQQPLIGLFISMRSSKPPLATLVGIMQEANKQGWKVVIHPHPMTRKLQSSDSKTGFFNRPDVAKAFLQLQDLGATFVMGYAPGVVMRVKFQQCHGFELVAAADCLISSSFDTMWEAYVLKKPCSFFGGSPSLSPIAKRRLAFLDWEFEDRFKTSSDKIKATLDQGARRLEHDPEIVSRWLYKLDGLWWQRALGLAERLKT